MAGNATIGLEDLIALYFVSSQSVLVAPQIAIESGIWRRQRSLERGYRILDVSYLDTVRVQSPKGSCIVRRLT